MNVHRFHASWMAVVALIVAVPTEAGIVFYTDRPAWEAAAGPPSYAVDFEGFTADIGFRFHPLRLAGMTIQQEGAREFAFRNNVEVVPLEFSPNSGSNSASLFTDSANPSDPVDVSVLITFNAPNVAFGFESWGANDAEGAVLDVFSGDTLLGSQALTNDPGAFLGYTLDFGDRATSVRFRSDRNLPYVGEGFYIDNLAGVVVPEPGTLALAVIGFGSLFVASWRNRK